LRSFPTRPCRPEKKGGRNSTTDPFLQAFLKKVGFCHIVESVFPQVVVYCPPRGTRAVAFSLSYASSLSAATSGTGAAGGRWRRPAAGCVPCTRQTALPYSGKRGNRRKHLPHMAAPTGLTFHLVPCRENKDFAHLTTIKTKKIEKRHLRTPWFRICSVGL
jgi:hypothetical protein